LGYDYVNRFPVRCGVADRFDPASTRIAPTAALQPCVKASGPSGHLGCGSLMAPSVGFFDGNRIGPDVSRSGDS
jgi:hypothetical protein